MTPTRFYTISGPGLTGSGSIDVPCVEVLPEPGDILLVAIDFVTPGDKAYLAGDEIHLIKRVWEAPFGKLSQLGNWQAISKFGVSVWSNIEWAMAEGQLVQRTPSNLQRHVTVPLTT